MSLSSYKHSIKFEYRQFPSIFEGFMPLLELKILEIHSFPQFSPTCFDILGWNFVYDFVLMNYRSSLSFVNFYRSYPFRNLEYWKYTVFRTFLLHALTYWAKILHVFILLYYRSSLSVVKFCRSYAPFGTSNSGNTQFFAVFSYMLWHIALKFCIWLCFTVLHINLSVVNLRQFLYELCPFWTLEYWENTVFCTFLLHALTYSAEILHMTLFYCTTD